MLKIVDIKENKSPEETGQSLVETINICIEALADRGVKIFDADDDEWCVDRIEYDEVYKRFCCHFKDI